MVACIDHWLEPRGRKIKTRRSDIRAAAGDGFVRNTRRFERLSLSCIVRGVEMSVEGQTRTSSDLDVMSTVLLITNSTRTSSNVAGKSQTRK